MTFNMNQKHVIVDVWQKRRTSFTTKGPTNIFDRGSSLSNKALLKLSFTERFWELLHGCPTMIEVV